MSLALERIPIQPSLTFLPRVSLVPPDSRLEVRSQQGKPTSDANDFRDERIDYQANLLRWRYLGHLFRKDIRKKKLIYRRHKQNEGE